MGFADAARASEGGEEATGEPVDPAAVGRRRPATAAPLNQREIGQWEL